MRLPVARTADIGGTPGARATVPSRQRRMPREKSLSGRNTHCQPAHSRAELRAYARPRRLGVATSADGVYRFPGAETGLVPDVGFITAANAARIADRRKPMPFAPDLAVEVASPEQSPGILVAKARTYLGGGTRLVWVVWPECRQVDVWRAGRTTGPAETLGIDDRLDGADVVPGFSLPVADIFADPLGAP